jgi:hypothetical protein
MKTIIANRAHEFNGRKVFFRRGLCYKENRWLGGYALSRISFFAAVCRRQFRRLIKPVLSLLYYGHERFCPVCEQHSRKFRSLGIFGRKEACCSHCGAFERHRLVWLYFSRMTCLFDGNPKKMLHIAPEPCLAPRLKNKLGDDYLSADLFDPGAMVKMDVTAIQFPAEHFDVIYCSHVLEHILEDRKAMREFCRVLKPDGWAILLVPISAERTMEAPAIVAAAARRRIFGQEDHVRRYGPDYVDRLKEAGFSVLVGRVHELFGREEIIRMGLTAATGDIFYCTKA